MEIWLHGALHPFWDWVAVRGTMQGEEGQNRNQLSTPAICVPVPVTSQTRMFEHEGFYVLGDGFYSFVLQAEAVSSNQEDY